MQHKPAMQFEDSLGLRREVIDACRHLHQNHHFIATWGNISVRLKEGMLITPSAFDYEEMQPDDLVIISWDEMKVIQGNRLPSSETQLHWALLKRRPDLGAAIHTHSRFLTALACAGRSLPVCVEDMAQIGGGEIKCTSYIPGSKHKEVAEAACDAIGSESMAILLGNHGPVICGRTPAEAVTAVEIMEKAAMSYIFASILGGCRTIPDDNVREERYRFLYKYGKAEDDALI